MARSDTVHSGSLPPTAQRDESPGSGERLREYGGDPPASPPTTTDQPPPSRRQPRQADAARAAPTPNLRDAPSAAHLPTDSRGAGRSPSRPPATASPLGSPGPAGTRRAAHRGLLF